MNAGSQPAMQDRWNRWPLLLWLLIILLTLAGPAHAREAVTAQDSLVLLPDGVTTPRPVLILLPFTGGDAQRLHDWRYGELLPELAEELGLILVIPSGAGSTANYASSEAWTRTLEDYGHRIAADADEVVRRHGGDARRIVLAGYSMGGDLAWALPLRDPERYAGAIVMGSRTSYRDKPALERLAARGFRYFLFMGEHENPARIAGMAAARAALQSARMEFRNGSAAEAHIPAPPEVFEQALRYVLEAAAGQTVVRDVAVPAAPVARENAGAAILPLPPPCPLQAFLDESEEIARIGYRDARGTQVIAPAYSSDSKGFVGGFAEVWRASDAAHGHIDCQGRFIATEEFGPQPFSEGLARSAANGRVGYVNVRGELVIPHRYDGAGRFCSGVAQVGQGCNSFRHGGALDLDACRVSYFIDQRGQRVAPPQPRPDPETCGRDGTQDEATEEADEADESEDDEAAWDDEEEEEDEDEPITP